MLKLTGVRFLPNESYTMHMIFIGNFTLRIHAMSFKALTDRLPTYLQELFIKCNNNNYYLRSNNSRLALPKPKTNFLKRSFSYRAAQGWNELPNSITENFDELSLSAFKRRI